MRRRFPLAGALGVAAILVAGLAFPLRASAGSCPLTQGFWKNHFSAWPSSVTTLIIGSHPYSQSDLLALLQMPVQGDASINLAHQLIAAELNIHTGSIGFGSVGDQVSSTIQAADLLLVPYSGALPYGVSSSSPTGQAMIADANFLESFNNGSLTPSCVPR